MENKKNFTHVEDIVDGLVRCVGKDFKAEEFNWVEVLIIQ